MLRGIAAMMVVFVHLDVQLRRLNLGSVDRAWMATGVDIFFVISGFIMWVTISFWDLLDRTDLELSIFGKQPLWLLA